MRLTSDTRFLLKSVMGSNDSIWQLRRKLIREFKSYKAKEELTLFTTLLNGPLSMFNQADELRMSVGTLDVRVRSDKRVDGSQDGRAELSERINSNAGWKEAGEDQLKEFSVSG